ncbi:unnamed protein product [Paramecium sonneborni]|uniref:H-type lectin domain-containing protein n=1 Tax=Paramecium sonneborni TaxID=65129 RepID=A0A8S1RJU9_9CILI|nr:unnamed protein product [Paramecium sonneborni]
MRMLVIILVQASLGYITYDESTFRSFHIANKGFLCFKNYQRTQTVRFKDSFENIPKVILIPELFDILTETVNYSLEILSISERNFTLRIICSEGLVNGVHYRWLAIDDARIQVISQFNLNEFNEKAFDKVNRNAQKYFVSLISVSYKGEVNFELKVSEITESKVVVVISDPMEKLSNIISLGYQIVLGTDDMLQSFGMKETDSLNSYISEKYQLKQESWFIVPFQGFQSNSDDKMRLKKIYYSDSNFQWYEIKGVSCCCDIVDKHSPMWMSFVSTLELTSFVFGKVNIKQMVNLKTDYTDSFKAVLQGQINYIMNFGETKQVIHKDQQSIQLNIYVKCNPDEMTYIEFNYGKEQNTNSNTFIHKCNWIFNEILYSIQLIRTSIAYQELIFNIQDEKCEISQVLYNQRLIKVKLFEIIKTKID